MILSKMSEQQSGTSLPETNNTSQETKIDPGLLFALPTKYAPYFSDKADTNTLLGGIRKSSSF